MELIGILHAFIERNDIQTLYSFYKTNKLYNNYLNNEIDNISQLVNNQSSKYLSTKYELFGHYAQEQIRILKRSEFLSNNIYSKVPIKSIQHSIEFCDMELLELTIKSVHQLDRYKIFIKGLLFTFKIISYQQVENVMYIHSQKELEKAINNLLNILSPRMFKILLEHNVLIHGNMILNKLIKTNRFDLVQLYLVHFNNELKNVDIQDMIIYTLCYSTYDIFLYVFNNYMNKFYSDGEFTLIEKLVTTTDIIPDIGGKILLLDTTYPLLSINLQVYKKALTSRNNELKSFIKYKWGTFCSRDLFKEGIKLKSVTLIKIALRKYNPNDSEISNLVVIFKVDNISHFMTNNESSINK
jgi:hypothetical protein